MAKVVLLDEFHLSVFAPRGLSEAEFDTIYRTLNDAGFHAELRRAVREVVRQRPTLARVRVRLSR
jgi:hypothetical protein